MRVTITGEKGFIGSLLLTRLTQEGHKQESWPDRVDVLFHLGALVRNDKSCTWPEETMRANILWPVHLFDTSRTKGIQIVYTSSAVVYSPVRTPYQISKIAADSLAQWYNDNGGDIRIIRLAEVYGPGMRNGPIAAWRDQYRKNGVIDVWDAPAKKDYIYISDAVEALIQAVSLPAGVYDVCSGVQTDILEFAKMLNVPYRMVPSPRPVASKIQQTPDNRFAITIAPEDGMEIVRKAEFA